MGIIEAAKLVHEYIRRDEEGKVEEIRRAVDGVDLDVQRVMRFLPIFTAVTIWATLLGAGQKPEKNTVTTMKRCIKDLSRKSTVKPMNILPSFCR